MQDADTTSPDSSPTAYCSTQGTIDFSRDEFGVVHLRTSNNPTLVNVESKQEQKHDPMVHETLDLHRAADVAVVLRTSKVAARELPNIFRSRAVASNKQQQILVKAVVLTKMKEFNNKQIKIRGK